MSTGLIRLQEDFCEWPGSTDYTGLNKPPVFFLLTWEPEQQETEELPEALMFTVCSDADGLLPGL